MIKLLLKPVAWLLSWMFFWIGHVWSLLLEDTEEDDSEKLVEFLYNRYNNNMRRSLAIQEWANNKTPWTVGYKDWL